MADSFSVMNGRSISGTQYWALTLLFLAGVLNLFDRQIVNILAQDIKVALRLSDTELGLLTGTAFGIFYSVMSIPLGRLADRVDRVKLIAVILTLWSGFTALCGATSNFVQLFLARMGVGVGESGSQPASAALISDYFPEEQRTSAMSVLFVGAPVGSFMGLLVGGYVGSIWGWRTAFVVAGIPGFILAVVMWLSMRDPRLAKSVQGKPASGNLIQALGVLLRDPKFRWLALGLTCSTFFPYASGAWFPPFFIRVFGMKTAEIGTYSAIAVGLGGGLATLSSGFVCDFLLRRHVRNAESKLLLVLFAVSIPAMLGTVLSADRSMALASMFVFNICAYAWLGPTVSLIQKIAPPETRALALAAASAMASILTAAGGLPLIGAISDALTAEQGARAVGYALGMTVVAVAVLGLIAHWRALCTPSRVQTASTGEPA